MPQVTFRCLTAAFGHHGAVPVCIKLIHHDSVMPREAAHRRHQQLQQRLFGVGLGKAIKPLIDRWQQAPLRHTCYLLQLHHHPLAMTIDNPAKTTASPTTLTGQADTALQTLFMLQPLAHTFDQRVTQQTHRGHL